MKTTSYPLGEGSEEFYYVKNCIQWHYADQLAGGYTPLDNDTQDMVLFSISTGSHRYRYVVTSDDIFYHDGVGNVWLVSTAVPVGSWFYFRIVTIENDTYIFVDETMVVNHTLDVANANERIVFETHNNPPNPVETEMHY